jgi:hypothetical protein
MIIDRVSHGRQAQPRRRPRYPENREFFATYHGIWFLLRAAGEGDHATHDGGGVRPPCLPPPARSGHLPGAGEKPALAPRRVASRRRARSRHSRRRMARDGLRAPRARRGPSLEAISPRPMAARIVAIAAAISSAERMREKSMPRSSPASARRRRRDEPQHRQPQIPLAPDQRSPGCRVRPAAAAARAGGGAGSGCRAAFPSGCRNARRRSGPSRPGRARRPVPRARTRASRNRIRTKRLKILESDL